MVGAQKDSGCYDANNTVPRDALAFEGFVARLCLSFCNRAPFQTGELKVVGSYRKRQGAGTVTQITIIRMKEHAAKARRKEVRVPYSRISSVSGLCCHEAGRDTRSPVQVAIRWWCWPLGYRVVLLGVVLGDIHGLAWCRIVGLSKTNAVAVR